MKNLFLSIIASSFLVLACKKNNTRTDVTSAGSPDSSNAQTSYSDTANSTAQSSKNNAASSDSINTKTHIGGRKTSNNNTGNGKGNVNAAVSDSANSRK